MIIRQPRQRIDLAWDYTEGSDESNTLGPIGYCNSDAAVYDPARAAKYHRDGHATPEEAKACYDQWRTDHEPARKALGQVAFEAYNAAVGGLTWDGKPIPGWDQITDKIRAAWNTAARAAKGAPL